MKSKNLDTSVSGTDLGNPTHMGVGDARFQNYLLQFLCSYQNPPREKHLRCFGHPPKYWDFCLHYRNMWNFWWNRTLKLNGNFEENMGRCLRQVGNQSKPCQITAVSTLLASHSANSIWIIWTTLLGPEQPLPFTRSSTFNNSLNLSVAQFLRV